MNHRLEVGSPTYRARCGACNEIVSPAGRSTQIAGAVDLAAHLNIVHEVTPVATGARLMFDGLEVVAS